MDETRKKEPLIRVEKRKERPAKQVRLLRLASVLLAIVAGGLFILCIGYNPFSVYATIVSGDDQTYGAAAHTGAGTYPGI